MDVTMEFTVEPSGKRPFRYNLGNVGGSEATTSPCHRGKPCRSCLRTGNCLLILAVSPVLDYFSGLSSYETVEVRYREDGYRAAFEETGQRAAFVLLVQGMLHSSCPFFSRFSSLLSHYRVNITYEMFMHLVLTTALLGHRTDSPGALAVASLQAEVRRLSLGIEERLRPILDETRRRRVKDAAINAMTIMFNCNMLAAESIEDYHREVADMLRLMPLPVEAARA